MNDPLPDEDLAALFARQRALDRERAPNFQAMRARSREAGPAMAPPVAVPWLRACAAAVALLLGIAAVGAVHQHRVASAAARHEAVIREIARIDAALRRNLAAQNSLTAWQSPTDFLLQPIHAETP